MKKRNRGPFKRWKKLIRNDQDFDFSYLWKLELAKLKFMLEFWESDSPCTSKDNIIRYLKLAIRLLESVYEEREEVWEIEYSPITTEKSEKYPGLWEVHRDREQDRIKKIGYVNTRNANRFLGSKVNDWRTNRIKELNSEYGIPNSVACQFENDLWSRKAKHLYHLIREYHDEEWWD